MTYDNKARCASAHRTRRSAGRALRLVVVALCTFFSSCKIVILFGPKTVTTGEIVTYEVEVSGRDPELGVDLFVVADVPMGWELQASSFSATLDGMPVSGSGVPFEDTVCESDLGPPRSGFRRWHLRPETAVPVLSGAGIGRVTIEFLVTEQPAQEYDIFFVFGGEFFESECSTPAGLVINRVGPSFLTLVQELFDGAGGVDGLSGPGEALPSADGRHLYVAGGLDSSVAAFSRDPASGALALLGTAIDGTDGITGLAVPRGLAESPDGQHLYVASHSNLDTGDPGGTALFSRDPANSELTFVEHLLEDVANVRTSPDGRFLYASEFGITVYARNEASGQLTFVETVFPGGELMMSPDGRHLYAAGFSSIAAYARDESSGQLTFLQSSGPGAAAALSPDGRHIYAVTSSDSMVAVFERDEATGALSLGPLHFFDPPHISIAPQAVAVSPDGSHVIVVGRLAIAVFQRNRVTGELASVEHLYPGHLPITELDGPRALTFGPDGRQLYLTSLPDDALLVFETAVLFHDGFETGTASAWSAVVP